MTESHPFFSPKTHGFVRVAAAGPVVHVGDPKANAAEHLDLIRQADEQGVDLMVFPELSLSAYAIDDLHMQAALLEAVERQIAVLRPFAWGSGLIARATVRLVLAARGVDPSLFSIPEHGVAELGRPAYVRALQLSRNAAPADLPADVRAALGN